MYILDQLQRHMNKYNLTQRSVAPRIPMDRAMLNKLFKGVKKPTENHIAKITKYLESFETKKETNTNAST
jgi:predicted transcriptional regulator